MILFAVFIILPLVEIALFVIAGDALGLFATLLLCVASLLAGSAILRTQGLGALMAAPQGFANGKLPEERLFDAACVTLAGVLLIIPGFLTDALALGLLVPGVRAALRQRLSRHFGVQGGADTLVIEAEYERVEDKE